MKILEILTQKRIIGNIGEKFAADYLKKQGYKILERNYVAKGYEIDIIAECDRTVAFVEVKTRTLGHKDPREARPAAAVTTEKQRKIIKAASYYKSMYASDMRARFDIIEVYLEKTKETKKPKEIKHIISAFDISSLRKAKYK